ncbi:MAG: DUF937 domain-containing protein [Saprospiraceae bacterium]
MNTLFELLKAEGGDVLVDQLSKQLGAEPEQTETAVQSAFSAMLSGLSKNIVSGEGASSFLGALDRDHDGSVLNDLMGYLSGNMNQAQVAPSALNGAGILGHILGGNQNSVVDAIAKISGLDQSKTGQLLVTLAPVVMGLLGKMKKTNNVSDNTLLDLVFKSGQPQEEKPHGGLMGVFGGLLDRDGDGSYMDDILSMGTKSLLGGLFK